MSITVGYWSIKGLGAPLRMMVMYSGNTLESKNYELKEKEDGSGFDGSNWFGPKSELKEKNPLINLPYVIDGDRIITQTNACFTYLGRKFSMLGSCEDELIQCEELLCEAMDLRNKITDFCYGRNKISPQDFLSSLTNKNGILPKLELWLEQKYKDSDEKVTFFVVNSATAPDFHLWELFDQMLLMSTFYKQDNPFLNYSKLSEFYQNFKNLPNNSKYLSSKLYSLPINNLMAVFGSTPSGEKFKPGQEIVWSGSSGNY